jgi:hypothetical protein
MKMRLKTWLLVACLSIGSTLGVWYVVGMNKIYRNFDGVYYIVVAKTWYNKTSIGKGFEIPLPTEYYAAHFPVYPFLINVICLTGLNHLQSMVFINLLVTALTAIMIFKIWEDNKWGKPWWAVIVWLFWWPRMWGVRSVGSPETLFILEIVLSLYFFTKKKYWLAGVAGFFAAMTKSPGILLLPAYGLWAMESMIRTKKIPWKIYPVIVIILGLVGIFGIFAIQMGDFWAYFHSGDNIHLQSFPFGIFNSQQNWVGTWWLDDVIWMYMIGAIGIWRAFSKNRVWGWFGIVYGTVLLFVAHRDVTRYALPIVPVVILGLSELWEIKEVRVILALAIIPLFFYTVNFLNYNVANLSSLAPFL